jgi:hypothetical protein
MNRSEVWGLEQDLLAQLFDRLQRFALWILACAVAAAIATALYQQYKPQYAVTKASYTLADVRVKALAAVYDKLPADTALMLGALEIDELARFTTLLEHPAVWQATFSQPALCQADAGLCAAGDAALARQLQRQFKPFFQFEHKRRGNLLTLQWRTEQAAQGPLLLEALLAAAGEHYRHQMMAQLKMQSSDLQAALPLTATVGERSELSSRLDKVQAELHLWQASPARVLQPVLDINTKAAKGGSWLLPVVAALLAALLTLLVLLFLPRRC